MAALVQSYPQQSSTITMLQTRPTSATGIISNSQGQYNKGNPMHRNNYHAMNSAGPTTYRGHTTMAPVAPYAFTSTPSLQLNGVKSQPGPFLRTDQRTTSAPVTPTTQTMDTHRTRYPVAASVSTISSSSSSDASAVRMGTKDDSALSGSTAAWSAARVQRPQSTVITPGSQLFPPTQQTTSKPSPDRYRRPGARRHESESGTSNTVLSATAMASQSAAAAATYNPFSSPSTGKGSTLAFYQQTPVVRASADDMHHVRQQDEASRYRRRSIHSIDLGNSIQPSSETQSNGMFEQGYQQGFAAAFATQPAQHPLRSSPVGEVNRPSSSPGRTSTTILPPPHIRSQSTQVRPGSASKREFSGLVATATSNPAPLVSTQAGAAVGATPSTSKTDQPQLVNIPPRVSSTSTTTTDATKRQPTPSPLSKPMTMSPESTPASKDSFKSAVTAALQAPPKPTYAQVATNGNRPASPAARQLAAINSKEEKKSKSSRLRRAFSFGSAQELRKASGEITESAETPAAERARLRKERYQDEREAEQAKIAERQEAGGIGAGIYSGQGNFFSGSTDNLSISSTASSASIMLRKMGKGVKKSTRSLVGLFRPKSVIGVPAADGPVNGFSEAQVSMVNVEAERERVNVNVNPHDQAGGGTGYPKLERNSIDQGNSNLSAAHVAESTSSQDTGRRSIVGGEKERAEVLAAVKKGILKRAATDSPSSSPMVQPVDKSKTANFQLPPIPTTLDSPNSSAPSTPTEDQQGHKRTGSVALNGEDYFMSALRFRGDSKSVPTTPLGTLKRNATFSPRIQFHDTWPSGEYDRRGEIATCNRLTPMLAQQIKEELNTFKMEMEVHENSKIYTHFF